MPSGCFSSSTGYAAAGLHPEAAPGYRDLRDNQQLTHSSMRRADASDPQLFYIWFRQHERNTKQDAAKQRCKHCHATIEGPAVPLQVGYALRRECLKDAQKAASDQQPTPLPTKREDEAFRCVLPDKASLAGSRALRIAISRCRLAERAKSRLPTFAQAIIQHQHYGC